MSFRTRALVSIVTLTSLALFVGCSNNSVTQGTPPPNGAFSNSNLNGTYVFSVTGSDSTTGFFQTIAGTFTANGTGGVTGGTIELTNAATGFLSPTPITSGNYSVGPDGRGGFRSGGGINLQTSAGTFTFDFVLSSTQHGLITEFDGNGTGSGTLDIQSSVSQGNIAGQSFAFNLTGVDSTGQVGFGTVGALTLDANGNVVTGLEDFNENGNSLVCGQLGNACSMTGGSINLSTVPGTATLTSTGNLGSLTFDVYPVDSTHLKFIETDGLAFSTGDAFTQSISMPVGNNVFTVAGSDSLANGPFTSAGLIVTDGNGAITNASVQDINDVGNVPNPTAFTGSYSALTGGRSVLTLTGFINGNNGAGCNNCQFAAYPSSGGIELLEIDDAGTTAGVAYPQSATTLASGQGYGMNLAGVNFSNATPLEEDDIAEFVNTNGNFAGLIDFNDQGNVTAALHFSSSYTADGTVPGRGVVAPGNNNSFNLVSYVVDSSTVVFVEIDSTQVGIGSFAVQNATASSNAAATHLKVLRLMRGAKKAAKRH